MAVLRKTAASIIKPDDLPVHSAAPIRLLGLAAPILIPALFLALWVAVLRSVVRP